MVTVWRCVVCSTPVEPRSAVAFTGGYICPECIVLGLEILAEDAPAALKSAWRKHGHRRLRRALVDLKQ